MTRPQLLERARRSGIEHLETDALVPLVPEVGRRSDEDRHRVGIANGDVVSDVLDGAALGEHSCAARERGAARTDDPADHVIAPIDPLEGVVPAVEVRPDLDRPRRRRLEAEDDDVVGHAREHLSAKPRPVELVLDRRDPVVEIERPAVARGELLVMAAEQERHVGQHLVARLAMRHAEHGELGERVCLLDAAVHQESPHLGKGGARVRVVALVGPARPDGLLVEDDRLLVDAAEHAGAEPPVADRQCGQPARRRRLEPEGRRHAHRGRSWRRPGSRITASISRGSIGTEPVRFSMPDAVTTTVSSQRT